MEVYNILIISAVLLLAIKYYNERREHYLADYWQYKWCKCNRYPEMY